MLNPRVDPHVRRETRNKFRTDSSWADPFVSEIPTGWLQARLPIIRREACGETVISARSVRHSRDLFHSCFGQNLFNNSNIHGELSNENEMQVCLEEAKDRARLALFAHLVKDKCFHQLRTQEQLG